MKQSEQYSWSRDWTVVRQLNGTIALARKPETKQPTDINLGQLLAFVGLVTIGVIYGIKKADIGLERAKQAQYGHVLAPQPETIIDETRFLTKHKDNWQRTIVKPQSEAIGSASKPLSQEYSQQASVSNKRESADQTQKLERIVKDNWALKEPLSVEGIRNIIDQECARYNSGVDAKYYKGYKVDPKIIDAIVRAESNYNPNAIHKKVVRRINPEWIKHNRDPNVKKYVQVPVRDRKGNFIVSAYGLCGLTERAAQEVGVQFKKITDKQENIKGGVRYYGMLLGMFHGDGKRALIAHNAGPVRATRWTDNNPRYQQTKDFVKRVLAYSGYRH